MFNSLYGTITAKLPQTIYLETDGIEWDIAVPDTTLDTLPPVGERARVYTWLYHREDAVKLFGFATAADRLLFLDLLKVDGVGAKGALKIMSGIAPRQLVEALDSEDLSQLERLPGVGKKTAQKMMLTLKGKLALSADSGRGSVQRSPSAAKWQDVITALADMGYDKKVCEETIDRLKPILAAELDGKNKATQEELMFRRAIVELA